MYYNEHSEQMISVKILSKLNLANKRPPVHKEDSESSRLLNFEERSAALCTIRETLRAMTKEASFKSALCAALTYCFDEIEHKRLCFQCVVHCSHCCPDPFSVKSDYYPMDEVNKRYAKIIVNWFKQLQNFPGKPDGIRSILEYEARL